MLVSGKRVVTADRYHADPACNCFECLECDLTEFKKEAKAQGYTPISTIHTSTLDAVLGKDSYTRAVEHLVSGTPGWQDYVRTKRDSKGKDYWEQHGLYVRFWVAAIMQLPDRMSRHALGKYRHSTEMQEVIEGHYRLGGAASVKAMLLSRWGKRSSRVGMP
ncbi:MAG: hypothetical protein A2139_06945 [Desulfobacca sp. RBG_16_60_12]|nr:MAG: hypothetical protein A2139_06945 [Desulfobacca sp. RBG_16_60_12]OHD23825.1 MAG: hypothetical protein A2Y38_17195 [Spirochaetes bacterium GWB1_59_5]